VENAKFGALRKAKPQPFRLTSVSDAAEAAKTRKARRCMD
jgi:hypothetical protein